MQGPGRIPPNLVFLITVARAPEVPTLTAIQTRVVRLLGLGFDDCQVAAILRRSVRSIRANKTRAMKKTGSGDPAALARWAVDHGVLSPGDRLSPSERMALGQVQFRTAAGHGRASGTVARRGGPEDSA